MARPIIKQTSAEKCFRYFFGDDWKKFPIIELAIRNEHNRINYFDDELFVQSNKLQRSKTFNWNTDPSAYVLRGQPKAILRTGVHFYKLSYHHIWNDAKRYVALRPNTPGESLPVWRMVNGKLSLSQGVAIDQHAGGEQTTGSEGCQTAPRSQYAEFITFFGETFGVKFPLGVIRKPDQAFVKGIGNIPYILITQQQFDYIMNLPEDRFDSAQDIEYQAKNFVNVPKVQERKIETLVKPVIAEVPNAEQILQEVLTDEPNEPNEPDEKILDLPEQDLNKTVDGMFGGLIDKTKEAGIQVKEAGAVILNEADKAKEQAIDAAGKIPDTVLSSKTSTGFFTKIFTTLGAILTGQMVLPEFLQNGLSGINLLAVLNNIFQGLWNLRFWLLGALIVWFVLTRLEGLILKVLAIHNNTDPEKGNVVLVQPQKGFFGKLIENLKNRF